MTTTRLSIAVRKDCLARDNVDTILAKSELLKPENSKVSQVAAAIEKKLKKQKEWVRFSVIYLESIFKYEILALLVNDTVPFFFYV